MTTSTDLVHEIDPQTGWRRTSHIVPPSRDRAGHVRVMEARVLGLPVTALCGHVLVPSRDPRTLPDCARCLEVFREMTGCEDGWVDC